MSETVYLSIGDTATQIIDDLKTSDGSIMVLPVGTTVGFRMYDDAGALVVSAAGSVVDGALGRVKYQMVVADVDTVGDYLRRWVVTLPAGAGQESWPDDPIGWPVVIVDPAAPLVPPTTLVCTPWCITGDVANVGDLDGLNPQVVANAIAMSSDVLYQLSGSQWPGVCETLVRPCAQTSLADAGPPSASGRWGGRRLWGVCSCNRDESCGCGSLPSVRLGKRNIISIDEVKVDGEVVPPDEYRVDIVQGRQLLVRLPRADGTNPGWPCCQRLDLTDDEDGTWSVAFTYGGMPPVGGVTAAASLSYQLALAMTPTKVGNCRLPKRVTTITRQNVTVAILDPLSLFKDGMVGLAEVDLWIMSLRVGAKRHPAMFANPDRMRPLTRRTR